MEQPDIENLLQTIGEIQGWAAQLLFASRYQKGDLYSNTVRVAVEFKHNLTNLIKGLECAVDNLDSIEKTAISKLENGESISGVHIDHALGKRRWDLERTQEIVEFLERYDIEPYKSVEPQLITLTDAKKALGNCGVSGWRLDDFLDENTSVPEKPFVVLDK